MSDHEWKVKPPPRNTWIEAKWQPGEEWRRVQTCHHGCCVYCPFIMFNLMPPVIWRETEQPKP